MALDGDTTAVSAVRSAVNATLRISQIIYKLKAVDEQTQDLLDSTKHISATLQQVRKLRHQKSQQLECDEKEWIDGVLRDTDRCLRDVAALVEPARVDLQTSKSGRIGLLNRGLWVFRDSPKVATNLTKLHLTNQSLNSAMTILCAKEVPPADSIPSETSSVVDSTLKQTTEFNNSSISPPPSYNESEFVIHRRMRRLSSRTTLDDGASRQELKGMHKSASAFTLLPPLVSGPDFHENIIAELEATDVLPKSSTTVTTPMISVTQHGSRSPSLSPESELSSPNRFEGSDGLQLVDDCFDGLQVVMYQPYSPPPRPSSIANSNRYRRHSDSAHQNYRSFDAQEAFELEQESDTLAPTTPPASCPPPLPPRPHPPRSQTSTSHLRFDSKHEESLNLDEILPPSLRPGRSLQLHHSQVVPTSKDISSISLPISEPQIKDSDQKNRRPEDMPRSKSSESKAPATRVKSRGRAWLESQSEFRGS